MAGSEQLRDAGFAADANGLPRDTVALRLLCAFVGVDWHSAPPGWWFHPNESTKAAWQRVADEARDIYRINSAHYSEGGSGEYVNNEEAMNRFEGKT